MTNIVDPRPQYEQERRALRSEAERACEHIDRQLDMASTRAERRLLKHRRRQIKRDYRRRVSELLAKSFIPRW